jgi:hypothetical protein
MFTLTKTQRTLEHDRDLAEVLRELRLATLPDAAPAPASLIETRLRKRIRLVTYLTACETMVAERSCCVR